MRWLILTAASVFHIEEPVGSYDCFGHFILLTGRGKVPTFIRNSTTRYTLLDNSLPLGVINPLSELRQFGSALAMVNFFRKFHLSLELLPGDTYLARRALTARGSARVQTDGSVDGSIQYQSARLIRYGTTPTDIKR